MTAFSRIVHVLAVGLWFGTTLFFTFVVGLSLFDTFGELSAAAREDRVYWLPLPVELEKSPPSATFPDPLRKEQGSRLAGAAVGPMFKWYYFIQVGCGVLAALSAVLWSGHGGVHKARFLILVLATAGAAAGWWLEGEVERLRVDRNEKSDVVLRSSSPSADAVQAADAVRTEFSRWHTYSLYVNFATVALVTIAMAMTAALPPRGQAPNASE